MKDALKISYPKVTNSNKPGFAPKVPIKQQGGNNQLLQLFDWFAKSNPEDGFNSAEEVAQEFQELSPEEQQQFIQNIQAQYQSTMQEMQYGGMSITATPNRKYQDGGITELGYSDGSPYLDYEYLPIDSNYLTMEDTGTPLIGVGEQSGEMQYMLPYSGDYYFPNDESVIEYPLAQTGKKSKEAILNDIKSFAQKKGKYIPDSIKTPEKLVEYLKSSKTNNKKDFNDSDIELYTRYYDKYIDPRERENTSYKEFKSLLEKSDNPVDKVTNYILDAGTNTYNRITKGNPSVKKQVQDVIKGFEKLSKEEQAKKEKLNENLKERSNPIKGVNGLDYEKIFKPKKESVPRVNNNNIVIPNKSIQGVDYERIFGGKKRATIDSTSPIVVPNKLNQGIDYERIFPPTKISKGIDYERIFGGKEEVPFEFFRKPASVNSNSKTQEKPKVNGTVKKQNSVSNKTQSDFELKPPPVPSEVTRVEEVQPENLNYKFRIPVMDLGNYYIPQEDREVNLNPNVFNRTNIGVGKQFFKQSGGDKGLKFKSRFNPNMDINLGAETNQNFYTPYDNDTQFYPIANFDFDNSDSNTLPLGVVSKNYQAPNEQSSLMFEGRSSDNLLDLKNYGRRFNNVKDSYNSTPVVNNQQNVSDSKWKKILDLSNKNPLEYAPMFQSYADALYTAPQYKATANIRGAFTPEIDPRGSLQSIDNQLKDSLRNIDLNSSAGQAIAAQFQANANKEKLNVLNDIALKNSQIRATNSKENAQRMNLQEQTQNQFNAQYYDNFLKAKGVSTKEKQRALNALLSSKEQKEANERNYAIATMPYSDFEYRNGDGIYRNTEMKFQEPTVQAQIKDLEKQIETLKKGTKQLGGFGSKFKFKSL